MKDYLLELTAKQTGQNAKRNTLREYLQAYALRVMHDNGVFRSTAFLGGTALRFLHNLPRYSEDLGFSVSKEGERGYEFAGMIAKVQREFELAGYNVSAAVKETKTVQSAFVRFEGLLAEAGIAPMKSQKFSIKIEIDTNPPQGAGLQTDIVNKYFPISFLAYDLPSLFAGKTHALLSRKYTKGRDLFDLGWYLSRWKDLAPNMKLLANALKQTGWDKPLPKAENWRKVLAKAVRQADWNTVRQDVENFLENPKDLEIFTQENVLRLLEQ